MFKFLVVAALIALTQASILPTNVLQNPCRAQGNATHFDISSAFPWPLRLTGPTPYNYTYWWDCNGKLTPCGPGVAFCQKADIIYDVGSPKNVIFSGQYYTLQIDKEIDIMYFSRMGDKYNNGQISDGLRAAHIKIVIDKTVPKGEYVATLVTEDVFCEYSVTIRTQCDGCEGYGP
eukprot:PhF_6_TR17434/c0_g1_i1/m.26681